MMKEVDLDHSLHHPPSPPQNCDPKAPAIAEGGMAKVFSVSIRIPRIDATRSSNPLMSSENKFYQGPVKKPPSVSLNSSFGTKIFTLREK